MKIYLSVVKSVILTVGICNGALSQHPDSSAFEFPIQLLQFQQRIHELYDQLPTDSFPSGFFFNKGFESYHYLESIQSGIPLRQNDWSFPILADQLNASIIDESQLPFESFTSVEEGFLEIHTLNVTGNIVDSLYVDTLMFYDYETPLDLSLDTTLYFSVDELKIFSSCLSQTTVHGFNVDFRVSPPYGNLSGSSIYSIDFGDGVGFRSMDIDGTTDFAVSYVSPGRKSIVMREVDDSLNESFSHMVLDVQSKSISDEPDLVLSFDSLLNDNSTSFHDGSSVGGSVECFIEGVLDKIIFISHGYDFGEGGDGITDFWFDDQPHLDELRSKYGYDLAFIKYDNTSISIHSNALIAKELIKQVNSNKVGNHPALYIGQSMGGIIGRLAIRQLELDSYDHQIEVFSTYDTPMKGAHIPLGAQALIKMIFQGLDESSTFLHLVWDIAGIWVDEIGYLEDLSERLTDPSLRQMIRHHVDNISTYDPASPVSAIGYFEEFQSELANIGYPDIRRVAIVNGSLNGRTQDLNYGEAFIGISEEFESPLGGFFYDLEIDLGAFYARHPPISNNPGWLFLNLGPTAFFDAHACHYCPGPWPWQWFRRCTDLDVNYFSWHNFFDPLMDPAAPGGKASYGDIKFCLVPTLSSLDFDYSYLLSDDWTSTPGWQQDVSQKADHIHKTPFDNYYGSNWNTDHMHSLNLGAFFYKEVMAYKRYGQNEQVKYARDFSAEHFVFGSDVIPNNWDKLVQPGDFIVHSNTTVNITGNHRESTIVLEDGFVAEFGSNVVFENLDVDPPDLSFFQPLSRLSPPTIDSPNYVCVGDSIFAFAPPDHDGMINWFIDGEGVGESLSGEPFVVPALQMAQYQIEARISDNSGEVGCTEVIIVKPLELCD